MVVPPQHQQFQPVAPPPGHPDPSAATAIPLQSLALHDPTASQAPPLPSKLDHNLSADPRPLSLPPPYQPAPPSGGQAFQTMPTKPGVYADFNHAPPPGSHGDSTLWVNSSAPSLHPQPHLHPSPTSTPPQQHSPMTAVQPTLGSIQQQPVGGAYPTHSQYQPQLEQVPGPISSHQMTSLPPQQQVGLTLPTEA